MILDSLHALSEIGGFYSLARLSNLIDRHRNKLYLTGKVFGAGRNPADSIARKLLSLLVSEGVNPSHMAVQWTELFLRTRGLDTIDFNFYLNKLSTLSGDRISDVSILTREQKYMAKTIIWGMTCGRSWLTGEEISYDESLLHHIFHDPASGKTLYGADYERLNCLAVLKGDKENKAVEKDREKYEDLFIDLWHQFRMGNYKEAVSHWKNKQWINDFLRKRRSRHYLDYWLLALENL